MNIKTKKEQICKYCNCNNPLYLTVDHKTPRARGGEDNNDNLQWVCWLCNQLKGALTHTEYLNYEKQLKGLHKLRKFWIKFPKDFKDWLQVNLTHQPGFDYDPTKMKKEKTE